MSIHKRHGLTRVDSCTVLACGLALSAIGAVAFAQREEQSKTATDKAQLLEIHKAMLIYSGDNRGMFPRPGLINRLPVDGMGDVPGRGEEGTSQNNTAAVYSSMVAQHYVAPELVVSPVERNPKVTVDTDYNFDDYNPVKDIYWDPKLTADLKTGSNASYAHTPIADQRARRQWVNHLDSNVAQVGNRGPKDGAIDPDSYTCGPHGNWAGNIVFGDNHCEFLNATTRNDDNLFKADDSKSDSLLAFTKLIKDGKLELQFD